MKKFTFVLGLALFAIGLFGFVQTSQAADYSSIYLSAEAEEWLASVEDQIKITPLTQRIEEEKFGGRFINPMRNITRSLRSIDQDLSFTRGSALNNLMVFIDTQLQELNTVGTMRVYGRSEQEMGHFLRKSHTRWGGTK